MAEISYGFCDFSIFKKFHFHPSTLTHLAGIFKFIHFGERFQKVLCFQRASPEKKIAFSSILLSLFSFSAPTRRSSDLESVSIKGTKSLNRYILFTGGKHIPPNYIANVPLQRIGTRRDVADATLFLASGASAFITANTLIVDGGSWMTNPVSMATLKAISKL